MNEQPHSSTVLLVLGLLLPRWDAIVFGALVYLICVLFLVFNLMMELMIRRVNLRNWILDDVMILMMGLRKIELKLLASIHFHVECYKKIEKQIIRR